MNNLCIPHWIVNTFAAIGLLATLVGFLMLIIQGIDEHERKKEENKK